MFYFHLYNKWKIYMSCFLLRSLSKTGAGQMTCYNVIHTFCFILLPCNVCIRPGFNMALILSCIFFMTQQPNNTNGHNDLNLQLSVSTSKPDHIDELLETTRKMTMYFKKSYKHNKSHCTSTDSHHPSVNHNSTIHTDKHKCKSRNTNDQVNNITGQTCASKNTKSKPEDIKDPHDSDSPDSNLDSSSDSK